MNASPEGRLARWAPRAVQVEPDASRGPRRKTPLTVDQIVATSFRIIEVEGYDALTMRRVAAALDTGPASLYAHVTSKAALDDLLLGRLNAELDLPAPDPTAWRDQVRAVCAQMRDQYLRYPGISRAALAIVPTSLDTLRVNEGMLAILLSGGVEPQKAAWTIDALVLYVAAYSLEIALIQRGAPRQDEWVLERSELLARFDALPDDQFPHTRRHAEALISGSGHDRFDFTVALMLGDVQVLGV